jgi:hypothetical protein
MARGSASIGGRAALAIHAVLRMSLRHLHTAGARALTDAGTSVGLLWVEPITIRLRLNGATRALAAISNVCAHVQDAHGVAEKLQPRLFFSIQTVVGTIIIMVVVASIWQHVLSALSALFDHIINNTGVARRRVAA